MKWEGFLLVDNKTFYNMTLKEILGLKKNYKMQVIQILIESMITDKEYDIVAFYETEYCK